MPITVGAKKKLRQDKKRSERNLRVKDAVKQAIKIFKKKPSAKNLSHTFRLLDFARKKNLFHKNKIARLKSTFSRVLQKEAGKTKEVTASKKRKSVAKK